MTIENLEKELKDGNLDSLYLLYGEEIYLLETVIKKKSSGQIGRDPSLATIDDVSYRPFIGIYNESLVAVFYGGKYHVIKNRQGDHTQQDVA